MYAPSLVPSVLGICREDVDDVDMLFALCCCADGWQLPIKLNLGLCSSLTGWRNVGTTPALEGATTINEETHDMEPMNVSRDLVAIGK